MDSKTETVSDRQQLENNQDLIDDFLGKEHWRMAPGNYWYSYHNDWNMLMDVVNMIEEIEESHPSNNPEKGTVWPYQFEILSRSVVQIIDNTNDNAIVTINQDGITKIEAVYKAVVEFIHWYNSQSPDTIK